MDGNNFEDELTIVEHAPMQSLNSRFTLESTPQPTSPPRTSTPSASPCQSSQLQGSQSSPKTSRTSLSKSSRSSSSRKRRADEKSSSSQQRERQRRRREEASKGRKRSPQKLYDIPIVMPQSESQDETNILLKRIENLRTKIKYYNCKIEDYETEETKMRSETSLALAQADKALAETSNAQARAEKARAEAKLAQAQADKARAEAEKARAEGIAIHEKMQAQTTEAFIKTLNALLPTVQNYMQSLLEKDIEQQQANQDQ